jgi:carboxyl-terminal processing protease
MIRDEIVIKTVFGQPVSKDIGYIRLSSFISQDAPEEMRQKLLAQKNTKAMILDIRGNNGGLLPNALDISDMFLDHGQIVSVVDRDGAKRVFEAKTGELYPKPLVVLIDAGSASASEILSGALKDNHRATLIGTKTFGKGLVQKINYLQDGSEINLTISKYYTPLGYDIDKKGIEPDIPVNYTESDFLHNRDPQKDYAIRYLRQRFLAKAS